MGIPVGELQFADAIGDFSAVQITQAGENHFFKGEREVGRN